VTATVKCPMHRFQRLPRRTRRNQDGSIFECCATWATAHDAIRYAGKGLPYCSHCQRCLHSSDPLGAHTLSAVPHDIPSGITAVGRFPRWDSRTGHTSGDSTRRAIWCHSIRLPARIDLATLASVLLCVCQCYWYRSSAAMSCRCSRAIGRALDLRLDCPSACMARAVSRRDSDTKVAIVTWATPVFVVALYRTSPPLRDRLAIVCPSLSADCLPCLPCAVSPSGPARRVAVAAVRW